MDILVLLLIIAVVIAVLGLTFAFLRNRQRAGDVLASTSVTRNGGAS